MTVVLWVMLSIGGTYAGGSPTIPIERFVSADDCNTALKRIRDRVPTVGFNANGPRIECIEMRVAR